MIKILQLSAIKSAILLLIALVFGIFAHISRHWQLRNRFLSEQSDRKTRAICGRANARHNTLKLQKMEYSQRLH